jgi:hypothetical protein
VTFSRIRTDRNRGLSPDSLLCTAIDDVYLAIKRLRRLSLWQQQPPLLMLKMMIRLLLSAAAKFADLLDE